MMKEQWLNLKGKWIDLAARERKMLMGGGMVLGLLILYQAIGSPLVEQASWLRRQIKLQQKTLAWMVVVDEKMRRVELDAMKKSTASPVLLLDFLKKQMNDAGLGAQLLQLKQISPDSIEMQFEKAEFDRLIRFLGVLITEQRVSLFLLSVEAQNTSGIVNATIGITRG